LIGKQKAGQNKRSNAGRGRIVQQKSQIADILRFLAEFIVPSRLNNYILVVVSIILSSRQGATSLFAVVALPRLHLESMK
jgi:hypothetical protein